MVYAHRGFSRDGNENSCEAFEAAARLGVRWIETDVNTTADGVVLVIHDPDLQRVVGVPGRVADLTAEQVRAHRLAGGAEIPTLAEVLARFPDLCFNIDVKDEGSAAALPAVVRAAGALDRIRLASFSDSRRRRALAALEQDGERVRSSPGILGNAAFRLVSAVVPLPLVPQAWKVVARVLRPWLADFDAFQVPETYPVGPLRVPVATRRFVAAAHACGKRVDVWTVDRPEDMRRVAVLGADGLVTNRADLAAEAFA